MRLKAIAFDLDGTLYPEYRMIPPSLFIALRFPRFVYHFRIVRKQIRMIRPIENFHALQAELLAKRLRIDITKTRQKIQDIIYNKWIKAFKDIKPYPGIKELLLRLKALPLKIAVLSDLPVQNKLTFFNLEGLWDCAFSSEESGYLKPNPEPFYKLIKALNIKSKNILYVGNNYEYDIIGAARVGLKTAHLSSRAIKNGIADFTFKKYRALENFLLKIVNKNQKEIII